MLAMLPLDLTWARVLVVSPHLDDAVLSASDAMTMADRVAIATVFCGIPGAEVPLTPWDHGCGFQSSQDAMHARLREDRAALAQWDATGHYLPFFDSQYRPLPSASEIAQALEALVIDSRPDIVVMPLGLHHCDHERVHEASLAMARRMRSCNAVSRPDTTFLFYEDIPYRVRPGVLDSRLQATERQGVALRSVDVCPSRADGRVCAQKKSRAMQAYVSQWQSVGMDADPLGTFGAERYWLMSD